MEHPSFESLLGYVENTIPASGRVEIETHLSSSCQECNQQILRLKKVFEAVQNDQTAAPSQKVLKKAFGLYRDKKKEEKPSALSRLAQLLFDSRQQLAPALVRGGPSEKRVLLYWASPVDIDLQITPREGLNSIQGQVLGFRPIRINFPPAFVSIKQQPDRRAGDGSGKRSSRTIQLAKHSPRKL